MVKYLTHKHIVIIKKSASKARGFLNYLKVDILNRIRYGKHAPYSCERLLVNPNDINYAINPSRNLASMPIRSNTGNVIDGDWDIDTIPFQDLEKYKICHTHFSEKRSWEDSNAYGLMLNIVEKFPGADNCYNLEDIIKRYSNLDKVYSYTKDHGRLLNANEVCKKKFREEGGIYIHIDRYGNLIFGLGGYHRLSIAKILELDQIPVQLGVVHKKIILHWDQQDEIIRTYPQFKDYLIKTLNFLTN